MYKSLITLFFLLCFSAAWAENTLHFSQHQELTKTGEQDDDFGKEKDESNDVLYDSHDFFLNGQSYPTNVSSLDFFLPLKPNTKLTSPNFDIISPPPERH